jgi:Tfp pilus assembly protein FimV
LHGAAASAHCSCQPVAYSLALDEISVSSHLGQPLEAVIPVNGAAGELLDSACFSVAAASDAGLPGIEGVHLRLDPVTGQLTLRSAEPVLEPLSEVTIRVRCNGAPALDRTFLVVLDPPDMRAETVFARTREATSQPATNRSAFRARGRRLGDAFARSRTRARASGMLGDSPSRPASIEPTDRHRAWQRISHPGRRHARASPSVSGRPVGSLWAIAGAFTRRIRWPSAAIRTA